MGCERNGVQYSQSATLPCVLDAVPDMYYFSKEWDLEIC
jgi:hypothetical protein